MTSWVYNNVIGLWYHMGYLFRNGFVCIVRRCKLLNPENISGYHQINKIGEFLQFSSKRKGIRVWNFRMMIRKIWRFLWYQNCNNFEKNEKRKDHAPLMPIRKKRCLVGKKSLLYKRMPYLGLRKCFLPQEKSFKLKISLHNPIYTNSTMSSVFLIISREQCSSLPHFVHACLPFDIPKCFIRVLRYICRWQY